MQFEVSIEDKLDEWRGERSLEEIDVFLPEDTDMPHNYQIPYDSDSEVRNLNTGFQVWKVRPKSKEILSLWFNASLPGCDTYYWNWPFEQGVLNHMKLWLKRNYDLQIQIIPCDEANGFPEYIPNLLVDGTDLTNHGCNGKFVSHLWEESKRQAVAHFLPMEGQRLLINSLNEISKTELWLKLSPEPIEPVIKVNFACENMYGQQFRAAYDISLETAHDDYVMQVFFIQLGETYNLSRPTYNSLYLNFKQLYQEKLETIWMEYEGTRKVDATNKRIYAKPINPTERILILQIATENYLRHEWEWFRESFPFSIIDLSKISVYNYAKRHGYAYHYIKVSADDMQKDGRPPCWSKVYGLMKFLQTFDPEEFYDYIVLIDVDMIFMQPEKPLFSKIKEWTGADELSTIDAFFSDDTECELCFVKTFVSEEIVKTVNSGFQIWKNSAKARKIVEEWYRCPVNFPGCDQFLNDWRLEQSALTYMYDYLQDKYNFKMKRIDCDEANGFPTTYPNKMSDGRELGNHGCNGKFISHFWEETKRHVQPLLIQLLAHQVIDFELSIIRSNEIWVNNYNLSVSNLLDISTEIKVKNDELAFIRLQIPLQPSSPNGQQNIDAYRYKLKEVCNSLTSDVCDDLVRLLVEFAELKARVLEKEAERIRLLSIVDNPHVQIL